MATKKKTAKTINRRVRHILKRNIDLEAESNKITPKHKKGNPTLRATRIDKKVKNWKQKQAPKSPKIITLKLTGEKYEKLMSDLGEAIKILKQKPKKS